ncbi:MAG: OmpA family protein [Salinivirgaceae bacterium]|nr:OmpA family protein [Salinivirgaceae bacterium]
MNQFKPILLLVILFFGFSGIISAQVENMVLNPSFEEYEKCPTGYTFMDQSHRLIPHWTYPTFTTPDYFNECSTGEVRVPNNFAGESRAKSGKGYMGAILSGTDRDFREYIQGSLKNQMEAGQRYCVSFWYKLASGSKFAVDQLSVNFVNEIVANSNKTYLGYKAQLNNQEGLFLDNTEEWQQFCMIYDATGGESFFLVGNFKNYDNTNYVVTGKETVNKKGKAYAYYYFDDFEIRPLVDCNVCACVPKGMETVVIDSFYTGGLDPITGQLTNIKNDGLISLGISGGTPPYIINWSSGQKNVQKIKNLPAGKYTYEVSDQNNCRSKGTIVFEKPVIPEDPFKEGLRNIEEGAALILNNIFFETGKSTLLPESFAELDKIVEFLAEGTVSLIEISGHTDSDGSDATNQKLSQSRAQSVVDYLVSKNIDANRLKAVGYGEAKPIDTNQTTEGKTKNRRVEFLVLKK